MRKIISLITVFLIFAPSVFANEVNIFSARHYDSDVQLYEKFTAKTGIKVNVVSGKSGALEKRIIEEGSDSKADLYITADAGRLGAFKAKGMLQGGLNTAIIKSAVPSNFRTSQWVGIAKRARIVYFAPERVTGAELAGLTYESLADPKWKGRICVRPGSHVYNRALVASMIDAHGMEETEKWAKGLVANLARRPQANDRAQVKAVFEGVCDIAIINNYYYGKLLTSDNPMQQQWGQSVKLIFPNQDGRGTHVNISGGGVPKYAPHRDEAVRFLEFLTSKTAQDLYGEINFEYPVNPEVEETETLKSWGEFKEDDMPISRIAELAPEAQRVIDRVGW